MENVHPSSSDEQCAQLFQKLKEQSHLQVTRPLKSERHALRVKKERMHQGYKNPKSKKKKEEEYM